MKVAETQMKTVLKDTIMALCRNMLGQSGHVQVEGLLGITLNHEEIFLVNISQSISKLMEVKQEIATEEMNSDEQGDDNESPLNARTTRSRLDDSPDSPKRQRKRGRRKKMAEESSRGDDDLDELQNVLSINNELQNELAESGSNDDSRDDTRLNISDSQAMLDVYGNIINSQADEATDKLQTFITPCDNDNESKDQVVVKTEVNSDEEQDSSCTLDSTTHNAPWPAALSSIFAPSMKMPSLHLPNITNMVMADGNSSCAEGSSVNPDSGDTGLPIVPGTVITGGDGPDNVVSPNYKTILVKGIVQHVCGVCGLRFRSQTGLKDHQALKHLSRPRYQCSTCRKGFMSKTMLTSHEMRHQEKQPFTCSYCAKGFWYKKDMIDHVISKHETEKLVPCPLCQKTFSRRDKLTQHVKRCGVKERHTCLQCGAMFTLKTNLNRHVKQRHNK